MHCNQNLNILYDSIFPNYCNKLCIIENFEIDFVLIVNLRFGELKSKVKAENNLAKTQNCFLVNLLVILLFNSIVTKIFVFNLITYL